MLMLAKRNILMVALGLLVSYPIIFICSQTHAEQRTSTEPMIIEYLEAARRNDTGRLRQELDLGVPVDSRDEKGRTALLIATHANAVDAARILIAAGADVNANDNLQDSPYLYAGAEGRLEILKMTIAAGADLESVNRFGGTALTPAAHHGHVGVVRYLLTTEINVNQVNNLGWTALLEAVILGDGGPTYQKIVGLLLRNGADPAIGDSQSATALEHAKASKQDEIVRLLELAINRED